MKSNRRFMCLALGLLSALPTAESFFAQATISSALLRGTVQDSSLAAVPRAAGDGHQ